LTKAGDILSDKDVILRGENRGKSAFLKEFSSTFLPSIISGKLGFKRLMERVYKDNPYDDMFESENKKYMQSLSALKSEYLLEFGNEFNKKNIDRMFRKPKNTSYKTFYEKVKKRLEIESPD
jgi:hypothetical protein